MSSYIFLVVALLGALASIAVLYFANRSRENAFRVIDLITVDNRASLDKVILALFAVISAWVIVYVTLTSTSVDATLLLGILTIFVLKRTADKVTTAYTATKTRPVERPE